MKTNRVLARSVVFAMVTGLVFGSSGRVLNALPAVGTMAEAFVSDQVWEDDLVVRSKSNADSGLLGASIPDLILYNYEWPDDVLMRAWASSSGGTGAGAVVSVKTFIEAQAPGSDILYSYARATNVLAWNPTSQTLPDGTVIVPQFTIGMDGMLKSWANNAVSAKAGISLDVTAYSVGGTVLSALGGSATIEDTWWGNEGIVFEATGDLAGNFAWDGNEDSEATIDALFILDFDAQVGETYLIEIIMQSSLYDGEMLEAEAASSFGNTLTYQFSGAYDPADTNFENPLDVDMVAAIPEPAMFSIVLGFGSLALLTRRKLRNHSRP